MRLLLLTLTLAVVVLVACESSKTLSDGTMLGVMTTGQLPTVVIDGKDYRLAPGARIIGANNTSLTPNQVPAGSNVRYRVDSSGQVTQVWILPADR
jgi:hypothetical protein